jgi:peroxiredoxin
VITVKKLVVLLTIIVLTGEFASGQTAFSRCYDTLVAALTKTGDIKLDKFFDWEKCIKGTAMPQLSFQTITGERIETKNLRGKVLMINLWFTSCHPCIAELSGLNHIVEEYKNKDVVFIGLCLDSKNVLETEFFPKYKFDFRIVADSRNVIERIGSTGYPTTYIIDKEGNVQAAWTGGRNDEKLASEEIYSRSKSIIDTLLKAE